jgi:chromosome segregation ATPase
MIMIKWLRLAVVLCCVCFSQSAWGGLASMVVPPVQEQGTTGKEGGQDQGTEQEQPVTLVEINTHINELPKKLIDLKKVLGDVVDVDAVRSRLPEIQKQIDKLSWQVAREKSTPSLSYSQLADIAASIERLHRQLLDLQKQVNHSLKSLAR